MVDLSSDAQAALSGLLDAPVEALAVPRLPGFEADGVVQVRRRDAPDLVFLIEEKHTSTPSVVARAAARLVESCPPSMLPLMVVPYMSPDAQRQCEAAGSHWLDLSGNAHIRARNLLIRIEGRPNQFKRPGRPDDPFAMRSARVARALLHAPRQWTAQHTLVRSTGLSKSVVSRAVHRLDELGLLEHHTDDAHVFRPRSAVDLLRSWGLHYAFKRHRVARLHLYAPTGPELIRAVAARLNDAQVPFAMTGLAAAWLHEPHASFRLVTAFVASLPSSAALQEMGLRSVENGANVWLVAPDDEDILREEYLIERQGIRCVDVPQTWLDLQHHPERAAEAAEALLLKWSSSS